MVTLTLGVYYNFMRKIKVLAVIVSLFVLSMLGGFLGIIVLPSLVARVPALSSVEFLNIGGERITVIRQEPEQIIIDKADAVARSAEKVRSGIVIVERQRLAQTVSASSALVVTSDGWIITPYSLAQGITSRSQDKFFIVLPGEQISAELVKVDSVSQLALFSVKDRNFYTPEFASKNEVSLGDNVFMLSALENETIESRIELGYISKVTASDMGFNSSFGTESFSGAAVFNTEGKVLALSVKINNIVSFIPIEKINEFIASARE